MTRFKSRRLPLDNLIPQMNLNSPTKLHDQTSNVKLVFQVSVKKRPTLKKDKQISLLS